MHKHSWGSFMGRIPLWVMVAASLLMYAGKSLADTKVRTSSFEYASGLLVKEMVEPGSAADCLQTSYVYDTYGNKTSVATSACAGGNVRSAASTYAAQTANVAGVTYAIPAGLFPSQSTNALGHTERKTYDPRFGVVTSLVGPNGLTTTWVYDSFGRKTRETRADKTFTQWAYLLCTDATANCPGPIGGATSVWVATEQNYNVDATPSGQEKRQYYDTLDRVIRVQTKGFDGGAGGAGAAPTLYQDTEYNALGQVARSSNLYASNASPVWSSVEYDKIGRVIRQDSPDITAGGNPTISTSYIAYNGLVTTVTNAKGQNKTTTKNAQGQVASVTDHLGSTIVYSYDALGQLLGTNAAGSITKMAYNQRGQKISMQDPAMGEWLYAYNAFGELVWQRDSLGQTVTIAYDSLGRMTQRNEPDLVSQWSYDKNLDNTACPKGTGKLCQAKTDNGYARSHTYDSLGRASSTSTVLGVGSIAATVSVAYDNNSGRITSKTWPTGYQAAYTYTATGYLKKVTGQGTPGTIAGATAIASYEVLDIDPQGRIRSYKYGNQVTTVNNFDVASGKLRGIQASLAGGTASGVLNHTYEYDSLANLTKRVDGNSGVSEGFGYDGLNRLTTYTALGGALTAASPNNDVQVLYDARGNINYKSDVGQYWYDTARPNRMTAVTLSAPAGGKALTGTRLMAYAFDDYLPGARTLGGTTLGNGNLMYTVSQDTTQGRHTVRWEEYTSFNMPRQIRQASLINTAAGVSTGGSVAAIATVTCSVNYTLSGSTCISVAVTPSIPDCPSGDLVPDNVCWIREIDQFYTPDYICRSGQVLSGGGATSVCRDSLPAATTFTCPSGYQLSGSQCKVFTNNATTGTNSTRSDRTLTFVYGPEHQRIQQVVALSANAPAALQSGAGTTYYLNGEDGQGLSYEKEVKDNGITEYKHYLAAGGMVFAMQVTRSGTLIAGNSAIGGNQASSLRYLHHDHLGSVAAVTDGTTGAIIERLAFDPWGKRRNVDGKSDTTDSLVGQTTDRGYTEHEHLDEMGIIHMNGRVYDPLVGRMMSADPFIQAPGSLQSYNRYSYVMNNPLNLTDPSGYSAWTRFRDRILKPVVIAVIAYYTGGLASSAYLNGVLAGSSFAVGGSVGLTAGLIGGVTGGFVGGALSTGNLKGGLQGAFTGGVFGAIGSIGAGNDWGTGQYVAAHAAGGCITSVAGGGNCGTGAASAAFGKFATLQTQDWGAGIAQFTASVVAGGVGSVIAGGKFENGATTAAFGYLFNHCMHAASCWTEAQEQVGKLASGIGNAFKDLAWALTPGSGAVDCMTQGCGAVGMAVAAIDFVPGGKAVALGERGLAHVMARHIAGGAESAGKSLFNSASDISVLATNASAAIAVPSGRNYVRVVDAGREIGVDRVTGGTSVYTVVTNRGGDVVTMHPGRPR